MSKPSFLSELEDPDWLETLHLMEDVLVFELELTVLAREALFVTFPLRENSEKDTITVSNCDCLQCAVIAMHCASGERFSKLQKEITTLSFPVTPLDIDQSLLNMSAFTGVSLPDLEMDLADIAHENIWVSKVSSKAWQLNL